MNSKGFLLLFLLLFHTQSPFWVIKVDQNLCFLLKSLVRLWFQSYHVGKNFFLSIDNFPNDSVWYFLNCYFSFFFSFWIIWGPFYCTNHIVVFSLGFILTPLCLQEYHACHISQMQHVFQPWTKPPLAFDRGQRTSGGWGWVTGIWRRKKNAS